jgi:anti-anti-sigma regulatory factor
MKDHVLLAEGSAYRLEADIQDGNVLVRVSGTVNEDLEFSVVFDLLQNLGASVQVVLFDLAQITSMNSCGIRSWILFIEKVQQKYSSGFLAANEVFIEQASIAPNMLGKPGTPVHSFEVPYYCEKCDERFLKTVKFEDVKIDDTGFVCPKEKCQICSAELKFDALEEEYLNFISHAMSA